jgi:hypothetical protein
VGTILNYSAYRPRSRSASAKRSLEPIVAQIIDALTECGGSAHRDVIANIIASRRAGRTTVASREIQDEVYGGFQRYMDQASARGSHARLYRPLGPDSYRWALTSTAIGPAIG